MRQNSTILSSFAPRKNALSLSERLLNTNTNAPASSFFARLVNHSLVRRACIFLVLGFVSPNSNITFGQTSDVAEATTGEDNREVIDVALEFKEQTWFTDVLATAVVRFPESVEQPDGLPTGDEDVSFADVELIGSSIPNDQATMAVIRFQPRHAGVAAFPSLSFQSDTKIYRTRAAQFLVSVVNQSDEMRFELKPRKTSVYVGQPLRIDVIWSSDQPANRFRALQCAPQLFYRDDVEVVIPRCLAPEKQQMGLPFGGRRIVARRETPKGDDDSFGTVSFPIFIRFKEPGKVEIPSSRLECALLKGRPSALAPYAAYYNNGLFEPLSALKAYDRVFVESKATSMDVRALPTEGQSELFSGLFQPSKVRVSVSTDTLVVGQVLNVDLRVHSRTPHGMLELKPLNLQRSLRGRFHVSEEFSRTWYPDGTGFRARLRPLSTDITALPSLRIPVFDSSTGKYEDIQTASIPLKVTPEGGRNYFEVGSLTPDQQLTVQAAGIWHNSQPGTMNQLLNVTASVLAEYWLLWILAGTLLFALLLPWVRERRRRAENPVYERQALAYRELCKHPEGTPEKWEAFLQFVAAGFSMPAGAWTPGDAVQRLRALDLPQKDIELITDTHAGFDERDFSSRHPTPNVPKLNGVAGRLLKKFRDVSLLLLALLFLFPATTMASQWEEAQALFDRALESTPGLPETEALYEQSALKFEAAANKGNRQGSAWYNAGNAWFKSGELGRAIACYRQARIFRPFDREVNENLKAARALNIDAVEQDGMLPIRSWPARWIYAALVLVWFLLMFVLLLHVRYRKSSTLVGSGVCASVVFTLGVIALIVNSYSDSAGVVIVGEIYGRKGPAYSYEAAFNEPLHDGLEFYVNDRRSEWLQIELADGRVCWIPQDQTRLIANRRF